MTLPDAEKETYAQARWNMFFVGGAEFSKMSSAKRDVISAWGRGPVKGPGSSRFLDALWCNLSHYLTLFVPFRGHYSCHFGNDYTGMYIINCKM